MRYALAAVGAIMLLLGTAGFWTDGWHDGLIQFESAENLFRVVLGLALSAVALRGAANGVRIWTRMAGGFFGLWGLLGLVQPLFLGMHFEPAENLMHLCMAGLCAWAGGHGQNPWEPVGRHNPTRPGPGQTALEPRPGQDPTMAGPGQESELRRTPEGTIIPPGPPETETGEQYEPEPIPLRPFGGPIPTDVTVTDEMLLRAGGDTANWLMYNHDYLGHRYVPDPEINPGNVRRLVPKWVFQTGILGGFETTPMVVNGVMYITTANGPHVVAINAATGESLWEYTYPRPKGLALCCGPNNRGVALGPGKLFFCTLDARLIALDAKSGRLKWAAWVGNPRIGESLTEAPLYYKGRVLVGLAGGEYNVKGRMHSFDAETGDLQWVFQTVADFGWGNGDPRLYGGACPWMTGAIDPETDTLFFGTGNPSPDFDGSPRPGPNPYSCSVVALDLNTGKLKWYYQVTPHDLWDYDSANPIFLYTATIGGKPVKAVGHADKNGFFYVLDRETGKLLLPPGEFVSHYNFGVPPTPEGVVVCPGPAGGSEWPPASYHPDYGLAFITAIHSCAEIKSNPWEYVPGRPYWGSEYAPQIGDAYGKLVAMDVNTGKIRWQYRADLPMVSGTLSTGTAAAGGGLVFAGEQDGYFSAFDARDGKRLWRFQCGAGVHAPAVSYRVGGRQFIAVAAGNGGWLEGYGVQDVDGERVVGGRQGDAVIAFGLPD